MSMRGEMETGKDNRGFGILKERALHGHNVESSRRKLRTLDISYSVYYCTRTSMISGVASLHEFCNVQIIDVDRWSAYHIGSPDSISDILFVLKVWRNASVPSR